MKNSEKSKQKTNKTSGWSDEEKKRVKEVLKKQKQKKERKCGPNIILIRVTVNEINLLIQKYVLKLVCNKTKSSYLLLTKDIPKANPYKNVYQAMQAKGKNEL